MNLEVSILTGLTFVAAIGLWLATVLLASDPPSLGVWTWRTIPLTLFGFAWLTFGMSFILRFAALAYDTELFRATYFPLWNLPGAVLTWAWICLMIFWGFFCAGYFLMIRWSPRHPAFLHKLELLSAPENILLLDALVLCCSLLVILLHKGFIPRVIGTPMSILGNLYVIPATVAWYNHFQGRSPGPRRFLYLAPGVLTYFFSPFRVLICAVALCILIPAVKSRRWLSLTTLTVAMLAFLLGATVVNDYRRAKLAAQAAGHQDFTWTLHSLNWLKNPVDSPWVRLSKRFHGFDSMALSWYFVPSYIPHSDINIFVELVWRVIPRAILDTKADTHRGRQFSTTIWALSDGGFKRRPETNISPSMCADLYQIRGIPLIILGAVLYGFLVGLLESWQREGGSLSSCIFLAIFSLPVALGIEQEFNYAAATLIQVLIAFFLVTFFLSVSYEVAPVAKSSRGGGVQSAQPPRPSPHPSGEGE